MKLLLIRHGMTPGNALRRYIGRTDEPLSEAGEKAVREAGGSETLRRVFVTPLLRTQQTAAILFPNAQQTVVDGLREMDFGDFENRSADEMESDEAYRAWVDASCIPPCPNGESMESFSDRVCAAFAEQILRLRAQDEDPAVFVVHGGTVMSVLQQFARPKMGYYDCRLKNCEGVSCVLSPSEDGLPFTLTELAHLERIEL